MTPIALLRLLQLSSQALPIGGYSHSQGLEAAIEQRVVTDESSLLRWISDVLEYSMRSFEIPSMLAMTGAWARRDTAAIAALNEDFLSTRESAEIRAATAQMGFSLCALASSLADLPKGSADILRSIREPSLPCAWSAMTTAWKIELRESVMGYLWTWAENQVLVALKAVPIGQSAGQRVLLAMGSRIADVAAGVQPGAAGRSRDGNEAVGIDAGGNEAGGNEAGGNEAGRNGAGGNEAGGNEAGGNGAGGIDDDRGDHYSNFSPGLAILSSQHETQYSRLFRS
jgi:urease accessory protein